MRGFRTVLEHPVHAIIAFAAVGLVYWLLPKLKPDWSRKTIRFAALIIGVLMLILFSIIFPDVD
ncbi:MAG: hypothetical protein IJL32_12895 [Oscillospiraceae bacterium]|nr:hypothetical protein [Oscillospiraceae bacterium]